MYETAQVGSATFGSFLLERESFIEFVLKVEKRKLTFDIAKLLLLTFSDPFQTAAGWSENTAGFAHPHTR